MGKISRYQILQVVFVIVFLASVLIIWFIVRNPPLRITESIDQVFETRIPATITAFPVTATVASVVEATATPAADAESAGEQSFSVYTVQSGDTLASIARDFNVTASILIQANGLTSNVLQTGQPLLIPNDNAFSIVSMAATMQAVSATQGALQGQATAVSATAQANSAEIAQLATRQFETFATAEANNIKIDILADSRESVETVESGGWLGLLTGPILASILAVGGFITSTWFEWRDDRREADTTYAEIERRRLALELKLLEYRVREKEEALRERRQQE